MIQKLPLLQIDFVSHQKGHRSVMFVLTVEFQPRSRSFERLRISGIVDDETAARILEVAGDETFETFLAGGVPELKPILLVVVGNVFYEEVDADGSLGCDLGYIVGRVEIGVDEPVYDGRLTHALVPQQYDLVLGLRHVQLHISLTIPAIYSIIIPFLLPNHNQFSIIRKESKI
jgi:hypothetical protein